MDSSMNEIEFYQLASRKAALSIWVKTGIQPGKGGAILKTCKQVYGLVGDKHLVLAQMQQLVDNAITAKDLANAE